MSGKCPKCEKLLSSVNLVGIDAKNAGGTSWKAITYNCPFCQTIISCQIDPIAVKADTVNEIIRGLKEKSK